MGCREPRSIGSQNHCHTVICSAVYVLIFYYHFYGDKNNSVDMRYMFLIVGIFFPLSDNVMMNIVFPGVEKDLACHTGNGKRC